MSTDSGPDDLGRRISRSKTVELQILTLLDISYRRLNGDHTGGAVAACSKKKKKKSCVTLCVIVFLCFIFSLLQFFEALRGPPLAATTVLN